MQYTIHFMPDDISVCVDPGTTLLHGQILAGLRPDAPCGGKGTCGKCRVTVNGAEVLACQTVAESDLTVYTEAAGDARILTESAPSNIHADGTQDYAIAFDVGTTTVVGYLLDGKTGALLSQEGRMNPQAQFGADVISRIQWVMDGNAGMQECIADTLRQMTEALASSSGIQASDITSAAVVGNTAMHHLMLGIDPKPLVTPPYMPAVREALEVPLLPISGSARMLPNIAGFVGGDTVGCMVATRFDQLDELTLLIDIGTNGEMVMGDKHRRIACSTAAGPAFEGAKISCGMRGAEGAIDHVFLDGSEIQYHMIGDGTPKGICGSGLLDLIAALLDAEILDESGYLEDGSYTLADSVTLTQKDVREVQLAKAAIRAGIELLAERLGVQIGQIQKVYLAGAFGNYLNPASACRIGMIPPELLERIQPIGNAAGEGAKLCSVSREEYEYSKRIAAETEFLELASMPEFQDRYVDALEFGEEEE